MKEDQVIIDRSKLENLESELESLEEGYVCLSGVDDSKLSLITNKLREFNSNFKEELYRREFEISKQKKCLDLRKSNLDKHEKLLHEESKELSETRLKFKNHWLLKYFMK